MGSWEWLTDFLANKVKPRYLFQSVAQPRLLWIKKKFLFITINYPLTITLKFGIS